MCGFDPHPDYDKNKICLAISLVFGTRNCNWNNAGSSPVRGTKNKNNKMSLIYYSPEQLKAMEVTVTYPSSVQTTHIIIGEGIKYKFNNDTLEYDEVPASYVHNLLRMHEAEDESIFESIKRDNIAHDNDTIKDGKWKELNLCFKEIRVNITPEKETQTQNN